MPEETRDELLKPEEALLRLLNRTCYVIRDHVPVDDLMWQERQLALARRALERDGG